MYFYYYLENVFQTYLNVNFPQLYDVLLNLLTLVYKLSIKLVLKHENFLIYSKFPIYLAKQCILSLFYYVVSLKVLIRIYTRKLNLSENLTRYFNC